MDKRELRLAIQEKLEHRRRLMSENTGLRQDVRRLDERNKFLVRTLNNPLINMALEECADRIMQSVMEHAIKASEVVADQAIESGDYEIGISIPSLHIRHRVFRHDVEFAQVGSSRDATPIKRVNYDGKG